MKFKIIIRNNETGKTVLKRNTNAMIAAMSAGEDGGECSILLRGTHEEMLTVMNLVQNEINRIYEDTES